MPPPRAPSAVQTPATIAAILARYIEENPAAAILEDGKVLFDLTTASHELSTSHDRCTLHLWSSEHNLVRRIVSIEARADTLRLHTLRFGQTQSKLLELVPTSERRTPTTRDTARTRYLRTLERILLRHFEGWKPDSFRTAMDLEKSFGPAYARGSITRGTHAWAIIGVNDSETPTTIDAILTIGILWLHHCREQASGKRLYQGLKLILPAGTTQLTLSRLAWLNHEAAQWELYELNPRTEDLTLLDPADQGNLRTRLIHHPDEASAAERFAHAIQQILALIPPEDRPRVDQRLRSTAELAFLLHGLEFARARISLSPTSFAHTLEVTVGTGPHETPLTAATQEALTRTLADLFARRRAFDPTIDFGRRASSPQRRIGAATAPTAAHSRANIGLNPSPQQNPTQDPLYRATPERWLESVLRHDLSPLTRSLAPGPPTTTSSSQAHRSEPNQNLSSRPEHPTLNLSSRPERSEVERPTGLSTAFDPDTIGNRADPIHKDSTTSPQHPHTPSTIPRLDPHHVYTQVPAIAGASDRGLLDLLGVTADGRLAVIELKADDDLHLALQGLDYWIRVRHHHLQTADNTGQGEFQRHGYFRGLELSPLPPRLYLVAPALHIHPATEIILRYLSPRVEWNLLALDERWRSKIRVVWRKHSKHS